jgi:hypothetical protein
MAGGYPRVDGTLTVSHGSLRDRADICSTQFPPGAGLHVLLVTLCTMCNDSAVGVPGLKPVQTKPLR